MPNVLIVEDKQQTLDARVDYFESMDNKVLGVKDSDSAIGAIRSLPNFDLVVTDIDLKEIDDNDSSFNKNGIELARWIKQHDYPCYVVGYSAQFSDGSLTKEELRYFDDFDDRSSSSQITEAKLEKWLEVAQKVNSKNHYDKQVKHLVSNQEEFTEEQVSKALKNLELSDMFISEKSSIRQYLDSNFELKIFLPEYKSIIRRPFPAWVGKEDETFFIEVVGQPYLYVESDSERDAETKLKELMLEFHIDLKNVDNKSLSPVLVNLKECLCALYSDD